MNELNENMKTNYEGADKYLAQMLEGAEHGITQIDTSIEQINTQLESMMAQREELVTATVEIKELLGLTDEEAEVEEAATVEG